MPCEHIETEDGDIVPAFEVKVACGTACNDQQREHFLPWEEAVFAALFDLQEVVKESDYPESEHTRRRHDQSVFAADQSIRDADGNDRYQEYQSAYRGRPLLFQVALRPVVALRLLRLEPAHHRDDERPEHYPDRKRDTHANEYYRDLHLYASSSN